MSVGKGGCSTEATVGKSGNQKNDSGPPSFGKQPVLLLHLTSDAADLGLTLIDFCHLTLYTHRGGKNHKNSSANSQW